MSRKTEVSSFYCWWGAS